MIVLFNFAYRKMRPPICVLMSILLMITDGFTVHGPSGPLVAPLGSSLVLPCYIDEVLLPMEGLEVEWRRTDSETLVHLYQDGESRPEAQQQEYHDRAHFFTDQIQHGNFSLRLDNLRAEDEGEYTCKVYSQQDSGETVVQIKDVVRLVVSGSDKSISVSVGEDVTLNCSVDSHITPEHIEEVSWKKRVKYENILVLLYQNNKTLPGLLDEQYRDRVEFFTDEIPKGNFSLRLKSVRTEDKGVYMCQVFAGGLSANATVVLERLGFSVLHIMVLILCISASGSALLLCYLIYCKSCNTEPRYLQVFLVFCPNMIMVFAFGCWGFSEGFLNESVLCCGLYFLRPLMLLCSAPCVDEFTEEKKEWIQKYSYRTQYIVFSAVVYSVLFKSALDKQEIYKVKFDYIMIIVLFVVMLLLNIIYIIFILATLMRKLTEEKKRIFRILARLTFDVLPSLQFIFMFYAFRIPTEKIFIVAVLPVFLAATNYDWELICGVRMSCFGWFFGSRTVRSAWLISVLLLNGFMFFFYYYALELVKELHRVVPVYLFGSVVVVLLNTVTLMTELILKTVNGNPAVGDLRVIVFSSEFFFTLSLVICLIFSPWMKNNQQPPQNTNQNQNTAESHEMKSLLKDQKTGRSDMTEENQMD